MKTEIDNTRKHGIFIFLASFLVRFLLPFSESFSHDELSSLSRTSFNSFNELLELGIQTDGHPALIQILNWILYNNIGLDAVLLKLPHIIAGSLSVVLVYLIAKKSFNESVGFLSAVSIIGLQIFVWNSQIIRPYSFGLLFFLAFMYSLKGGEKKDFIFGAIISGLFMALSAYTHYFAALASVSTTLIFFVLFAPMRKYLLWTSIIALVLFIPHLPITWHQLVDLKGIGGWLGKPNSDTFLNFIDYLFHHSKIVMYGYGALAFFGLALGIKQLKENWLKRVSLLLIFLFHFGVLFIYSVLVSPVLQNSALLFVSPLLLITIFSFTSLPDKNTLYIVSVLLLSISLFSLLAERLHHKVSLQQPEFQAAKYLNDKDLNEVSVYSNSPLAYYKILNKKLDWPKSLPEKPGATFFINSNQKELILIRNRRYLNSIAQEFGYFLLNREDHITQELYHYKRGKRKSEVEEIKSYVNKSSIGFRKDKFLTTVGLDLEDNNISHVDFVDAKISFNSKFGKIGSLVVEIRSETDEKIFWSSAAHTENLNGGIYRQYFSLRLWDIFSSDKDLIGKRLVAYYWNENGVETEVKNLELKVIKGNELFYGME